VKTRRTRPTGPGESLGERERLAWLVLDVETGGAVGTITRVNTGGPGSGERWQAYAIVWNDFGAPANPPVRLGGQWEQCRDAQNAIEVWHTERDRAALREALAEIRAGRQ
jgi:hypothetical protein